MQPTPPDLEGAPHAPAVRALQTGPSYERNAAIMIVDRCRRSPDRIALALLGSEPCTYHQLGQRIAAVVGQLRSLGVQPGDRVAYAAANRTELSVHLAATLHVGAIFVPLNTRLTADELRYIISDAGARVIVADATTGALIDPLLRDLDVDHALALDAPPSPRWQPATSEGQAPVAELGPAHEVGTDAVAVLMYTSGTTGHPKGAMISHGNIVATVRNLMLLIPMGPESGMLAMAPLFHIGALALVLGALATGGRVVLLEAFDPAEVFDALEAHPITFSFGVPAMLQAMTADPRFDQADLSRMLLMCAGAPVPPGLLARYLERGAKVTQGYGLTESTAVVSLLESDFAMDRLGSAGMPYPLTAVEIRDEHGTAITRPEVDGQIWIKGGTVVQGYWNLPEATAELFDDDGWLATGDAGHFDADGFLYITDRIKDMVISGGENVYPAEVEKVLADHPAVAEVAVIGTPDDRWGEAVTAVIALRPEAELTLEELQAFARQRLGGYKVPRRLHLRSALPRNAAGKVLKRDLRTELS